MRGGGAGDERSEGAEISGFGKAINVDAASSSGGEELKNGVDQTSSSDEKRIAREAVQVIRVAYMM